MLASEYAAKSKDGMNRWGMARIWISTNARFGFAKLEGDRFDFTFWQSGHRLLLLNGDGFYLHGFYLHCM